MHATITNVDVQAYTIPTDRAEADGTLDWSSTTIVIVHAEAAGKKGLGYTYASRAAAVLIKDFFCELLKEKNVMDIVLCWQEMRRVTRNLGVSSQVSAAIAAIDTALWDLKAKLLNTSLAALFGTLQNQVPVYGSGGFTTYDLSAIAKQIEGWCGQGIKRVKIKIGTHPEEDVKRVQAARQALGKGGELYVDANGAYDVKQALEFARAFREEQVSWFEEPVTSDNLTGLRQIRAQGPAGMDITAGEYGYDLFTHKHMLDAEAVDVLQIDVTRCQGYTGFIQAAALALSYNIPISSHCAPALHLPVCANALHLRHMEYFYDHVRIEDMIFDGVVPVKNGSLTPDNNAHGHGLTLKQSNAERYAL